jgi:hypothetical protein
MSMELFPDDHKIEGSLKVENLSGKEIRGSIHPDLVIDSIKDEDGNKIEYERKEMQGFQVIKVMDSITIFPGVSKTLEIRFNGKPYCHLTI